MGSRPSESRNDLLNRWVRLKREERLLKVFEKPSDPGLIMTLAEADKWRKRLVEELSHEVLRLYKEPLPEQETRYLNDSANRRIKEIRRFEMRIVELGGIDYSKLGFRTPDGDILNTNLNQYQYFGRARQLPGVKELLEAERRNLTDPHGFKKKIIKDELMSKVDSDYYGLYEDDDLSQEESQFEESIGASSINPDPIIQPGFTPSKQNLQEAMNLILSGKEQEVIVH
ncbi:NineTeen Complex (NTC) component [Tritrichomonas musculus]|uniref:NineTeen Complex (NTC) component n=1 Tax=Tritrichomonas musculus TaxID=1915356 RepID=A0ABR2KZD0_9EUKA